MNGERVQRLTDTFRLIRSKDAGPFMLTTDLFCHDAATYRRVLDAGVVTPATFAGLYGVDPSSVEVHLVEAIHAIKVSFPRLVPMDEGPGLRRTSATTFTDPPMSRRSES